MAGWFSRGTSKTPPAAATKDEDLEDSTTNKEDDGSEEDEVDEDKSKTKGKKTSKKEDNEDDDIDVNAAKTLYRALMDPETGKEIVEHLARRAGLLGKDGDKPPKSEDHKKLESVSKKFLREELGPEYEKFADKIGPALDKLFDHFFKERLGNEKAQNTQEKWEEQVDVFMEKVTTTAKIERKMQELIEDSPPNLGRKGFNAQKYLMRVYKNACEELGVEPKETRTKSAHKEVDDAPEFVVRKRPKDDLTLDEAVDAAMKGIRFKD